MYFSHGGLDNDKLFINRAAIDVFFAGRVGR
jgi:hypothetical protein